MAVVAAASVLVTFIAVFTDVLVVALFSLFLKRFKL